MTDIDTTESVIEDRTPETLLLDLAQNQLRAISSPLPRDPGALGWQMIAASTMALAARLLHTMQRLAPQEAAEVADWYNGPFGDGPDPHDFTEWLDTNVAKPAGADIEAWIEDGRKRAQEAKAYAETARSSEAEPKRDVHTYFSLSYANYLVLPRTLLQSMPDEWQDRFVRLLEEFDDAFAHVSQAEAYEVTAGSEELLGDMTEAQLEAAGIKQTRGHFDENDKPTEGLLFHRVKDGAELDGDAYGFVPEEDPVPHYNRGRTRVEPRMGGDV